MLSLTLLLLVVHTVVPVPSKLQCGCDDNHHRVVHITASVQGHNGACKVSFSSLPSNSFTGSCKSTQFILHQGSYTVSKNTNKGLKKVTVDLSVTGEPMAIISCTKYASIFKISRVFTTANNVRIHNLHFQNCREILIESNVKIASIEIINSSLTKSCLKIDRQRFFLTKQTL